MLLALPAFCNTCICWLFLFFFLCAGDRTQALCILSKCVLNILNVYSWNGGMKKPRSHREAPARGMAPSRKWNPSQGSHSAGQRWTVPELFPDCRLVS
jgi:hypothetical protein